MKATSLSLKEFVTHLVPKSAVEAMGNNGHGIPCRKGSRYGCSFTKLGLASRRSRRSAALAAT